MGKSILENFTLKKPTPRKLLSALILVITPILIFYFTEFYLRNPFQTMKAGAQFLNIIFFEFFMLLGFFLFKKAKIALRLELVIFTIVGLMNYYVLKFRSAPVMPWDIFSIRTAASVADNYDYSLNSKIILLLILSIALFFLVSFCDISVTQVKFRLSGIIVSFLLMAGYVGYVQSDHALYDFRLYDKLFTPATMTYKDGTVVAFCMQAQYLFVEQPEGYSVHKAVEILNTHEAADTKKDSLNSTNDTQDDVLNSSNDNGVSPLGLVSDNATTASNALTESPNIIVIMNEAFSDLEVLGEFETNEDPIPFVKSMLAGQENTVSGYLHASVLGGNTANSEYEFLTGHTMAFLPQGSIPYQQYIKSEVPSLASYLKDAGYSTIALHPYKATGWERNRIYPLLGFDRFISIDDFQYPEIIRKYVSDKSQYEKIIDIYEDTQNNEPLFLFNVTMQNHSSYGDSFDNFTPEIQVQGSDDISLSNYLSLLKISDEEIKNLIEYFSKEEEPTLLVFFGDHQPTDSVVSDIWTLNSKKGTNLTLEEQRLRYKVPFFLWANYDIEEQTGIETSMNYLSNFVLQASGFEGTAFHQFLDNLYQDFPVITCIQAIDSKGNSYEVKECKETLNEYSVLQYYSLFDKD